MQPIISVHQLSKTFRVKMKSRFWKTLLSPEYKPMQAVDSIAFDIQKGESVAFLGPNGAGKTTTIKMLCGLIHPSSGEMSVLGYNPFDRKKEFLTRIGLVMGNKAGLNWDLTPAQSFWLLKQIYRLDDHAYQRRLDDLINLFDIGRVLHTQVRNLSLGERMKMELIGSILHAPDVLFLDEPTLGLDVIAKQKIREFLREIQTRFSTTLLLTSHDMDDVEHVCDRVIMINQGAIIHDGPLQALVNKYHDVRYVTFVFEQPLPETPLPEFQSVLEIERRDQTYLCKVAREEVPKLIATVSARYALADIQIHSTPLKQIIADMFQK